MKILWNVFLETVLLIKTKITQKSESSDKNKEGFKLGYSIAELATSSYNFKEKLEKDYIFNRRVPHSGAGTLLGLSNLFRKSQPIQ